MEKLNRLKASRVHALAQTVIPLLQSILEIAAHEDRGAGSKETVRVILCGNHAIDTLQLDGISINQSHMGRMLILNPTHLLQSAKPRRPSLK